MDGHRESEGEFDKPVVTFSYVVCVALVIITMIFEYVKDTLQDRASESMKESVNALFSEMTVLGFIGLISFVVSEFNLLSSVSKATLDDEHEGTELLEQVHMGLFFVMVLYIFQTALMVTLGNSLDREWRRANAVCLTESVRLTECQAVFAAMRQEFIRPHRMKIRLGDRQTLPKDFNFGMYLSIKLGHFVEELIHLPLWTWSLVLLLLTVAWGVLELGGVLGISIFAITCGYLVLATMLTLRSKLQHILEHLLNPAHLGDETHSIHKRISKHAEAAKLAITSSRDPSISEPLLQAMARPTPPLRRVVTSPVLHAVRRRMSGPPLLKQTGRMNSSIAALELSPSMEDLIGKIPLYYAKFAEGSEDPHLKLFWFGAKGPHIHVTLIRSSLVFIAFYIAGFGLACIPHIQDAIGPWVGLVSVVAFIPVVGIYLLLRRVFELHVLVVSVEMMRDFRAARDVVRHQKTEKSMRVMRLLACIRMIFTEVSSSQTLSSLAAQNRRVQQRPSMVRLHSEFNQHVAAVFDRFDVDGSGTIDLPELIALMNALGHDVSVPEAEKLLESLDADGNGMVEKEEFVWWVCCLEDTVTNMSIDELTEEVFKIFDKDGSGSISITELCATLNSFGSDLTLDEIADLLRDYDEDHDGEIDKHEFLMLLRAYE